VSDHYLYIVPKDHQHIPSPHAQRQAEASLRQLAPAADHVHSEIFDKLRFIDAGGNSETIACAHCGSSIARSWWQDAMDRARAHDFEDLAINLPCCGTSSTLNDLVYHWPAGFANFVLEARNPGLGGVLAPEPLARLQIELGCELKQIMARY